MRAIRVHATGAPEVLGLEELPTPEPPPGHVRVRLQAVGVNFIEVYQRTGLYPVALPSTPGGEGAGEVVALGAGVDTLAVGDRVASVNFQGSYAEQALVRADQALRLPDDVATRSAAGLLLQGLTAHYLACTTYPLAPGDACLVHAAAGGVGLLLVQIAKRRRARVFATVSTEEKARLAREAGADEVILYSHVDFQGALRAATGGRGVQVVYDSVGRDTWERSLDCLAPRGMLVLYGQSSGSVPAFSPAMLAQKGSLFLTRPSLYHYVATRGELEARAADLFGWLRDGSLALRLERAWPLAEAADAHRALEARATTGKLLLVP